MVSSLDNDLASQYRLPTQPVLPRATLHRCPNRFADPTCVLYDEATEERRNRERLERLERFQARQQGSAL